MNSYYTSVEKVYNSLDDCIILGLTGRTGSGCSTAASILNTKNFFDLDIPSPKKKDFADVEERKDAVIYKFMKNKWYPFITIEVSSIILSLVFQKSYEDFIDHIEKLYKDEEKRSFSIRGYEELLKRLESVKSYFNSGYSLEGNDPIPNENLEEYYHYYTKEIKDKKRIFANLLNDYSCYVSKKNGYEKRKESKSQLYTYLLQSYGNNIRSSGDPFVETFSPDCFNKTAERIEDVIDLIIRYNKQTSSQNLHTGNDSDAAIQSYDINHKTRICIDAIRNPYEAYYLKDKYSSFYLISVSTDDDERKARLTGFDANELNTLDQMEYPVDFNDGKIFYQQSIEECLQISDIHLYNPHSDDDSREFLARNLVRYIALMIHPGIVTPTNIERCMQIAYTAKLNSGCLSRQVGSVITDNHYYIKAIGWNDVPQGQISCGLRTIYDYISDRDKNTFSKFELENPSFKNAIKNIREEYDNCISCGHECDLKKYSISYCFKDIYNAIEGNKNQVHTRSLHAEENSFLQASKFGGQGIQGGKLFVTASPCELCSKKSYQLGIRDIYYIDPYPGIASSHILKLGDKATNPDLHIFYGAIGNAYVAMYTKRFSTKDELLLLSGIDMKKAAVKTTYKPSNHFIQYHYEFVELELLFNNRYDIEFTNQSTVIPLLADMHRYTKFISWTGSSYEKTVPFSDDDEYDISDEEIKDGLYNIHLNLHTPCEKGKSIKCRFRTYVKDDQEIMSPFLSYHINAKTDKLVLQTRFEKDFFKDHTENFRLILYADREKGIIYETKLYKDNDNWITVTEEGDYIKVKTKEIVSPYLLYTYSLEWDWK